MFPSPLAQPFQPSASLEFAIFNDGIPSSVFYGMHPEHEVVQHIPDDAIEELFPPTAEDVAELEAAADFVETMAWLSYLDECDERARFDFAGYGKRWSVRRKAGLLGKPRPPAKDQGEGGSLDGGRSRSGTISSAGDTTDLVPLRAPRVFEVRPRKAEGRFHGGTSVPRNARGARGHRALIQQPRKHY